MKLTIGIPCYNQAEYLSDAIESALNQTVECEIIVVNDGSTDHSKEIAESYPVKVINQVNKGLPSARNTIIMNMTGDYLLPLDADDMLKEKAAEVILRTAEETNADVIAPSFKSFGVTNAEFILNGIPSLQDFKTANRLGYFSAVKKSVLLEVGGYSPRMFWGWEDFHLWIDIFRRGKNLAVIKEPLVLYRTKEHSMIHEANKHAVELTLQMHKDFPEVYA